MRRRRRSIARIGRGRRRLRRAIDHLLGLLSLDSKMCVHPSLGGPSSNREARAIKSLSGSKVSKVNPHGVGVGEGGPNIIENIISRRRRAVMIPIPLRRRPAVIFIPRRRRPAVIISGSKACKLVQHVVGVGEGGPHIISRRRRAVMTPIPRRRRPAEAAFHRSCVPSGPRQCHRFFCARRRRRLADRRRLVSRITRFTGGSAQSIHVGVVVVPERREAPTAPEAVSVERQADGGPAGAPAAALVLGLLFHDQKECADSGCAPRTTISCTNHDQTMGEAPPQKQGDPHARGRRLPEEH